jgi:uroporphyrinogen decarboxylase
VPVVAWIDPAFLHGYLGRSDFDPLVETIRVAKSFGFDTILRTYLPEVQTWETDGWRLMTETARENGPQLGTRITKTIETAEGELREISVIRETRPGSSVSHTQEHLVKTRADVRLMERYDIVRPPVDTAPLERGQGCIGDDGIVVVYGGGAAHTGAALYLRGLERLTLDAIDDPVLYEGLLNWAIEYEAGLLDTLEGLKPDLCQIGGLMAQGDFLGPAFYRQHVLPYDRRYIQEVHRRGLRTVYHNCGYSRRLLELYAELGTDAFETFPPPLIGDGDIAHVKQLLGDAMVLLGNIDQVHLLREGTRDEIAQVVKETVLIGKEGGRYVLMTGDELYHDTPMESLQIMAEVGREYGHYD